MIDRSAFLVAVVLLAGCGGSNEVSPAAGYDDCVDIGGTVYTVDGPVGTDDGTYVPCSDYRKRGITPITRRSGS